MTDTSTSLPLLLLQLKALDLCGVAAVTDRLAPTLAAMHQLQVLNLNRTHCTDATVDWLTYGHRLQEWRQATQKQQQQQQQGLGIPAVQEDHVSQMSAARLPEQWPRSVAGDSARRLPNCGQCKHLQLLTCCQMLSATASCECSG